MQPVPLAGSVALAGALFALYASLTPAVAGGGDNGEFLMALATCGVIHPTGYPLYTLAGAGFVSALHALGVSWVYAGNLFSALGAALALLLLHRLALRILEPVPALSRTTRFAVAALPVLALAFNPAWIEQATLAEVHSWQLAWVCGAVLVFAGLLDRIRPGQREPRPLLSAMIAWGLVCGLGGTHHSMSLFWAGALSLVLAWRLWRAGRLHVWVPAVWLGAGMVPLLAYAYVALRAAHPGSSSVWPALEPGWRGLWDHVTAAAYHQNLGRWAPDESDQALLRTGIYPWLWPGLALLALLGSLPREGARRPLWWALLAACAGQLLFVYRYGVPDPVAYFLPPLAMALLASVPAAAWFARGSRRARALGGVAALAGLSLLAVPAVLAAREQDAVLAQLDAQLLKLFRSVPFERGIVLWPNSNYFRLKLYQRLEGVKPGLDVYATAALGNDRPRERFRHAYGFDPLANNDAAHLSLPVNPDFVVGEQPSASVTAFTARMHETIVDSARVPVALFDPPTTVHVFRGARVPTGR